MSLEFVQLSGKVNQQMPYHCLAKVQRTLNHAGLPIKGARIACSASATSPASATSASPPP
jgi:UDP-N-acetyl-D-glucosamine dehydrogenase